MRQSYKRIHSGPFLLTLITQCRTLVGTLTTFVFFSRMMFATTHRDTSINWINSRHRSGDCHSIQESSHRIQRVKHCKMERSFWARHLQVTSNMIHSCSTLTLATKGKTHNYKIGNSLKVNFLQTGYATGRTFMHQCTTVTIECIPQLIKICHA